MDSQTTWNDVAAAVLALTDTQAGDDDPVTPLYELALASTGLLAVDAAAVFLLDGHGRLVPVAADPDGARRIDQHQDPCRPGPCEECIDAGSAVSCSDLTTDDAPWREFARGARGQGFRAVHAVPLARGNDVIGALVLLRRVAGFLTPTDQASARHLAAAAAGGILDRRAVCGLRSENAQLRHALQSRVTIEQAKGFLVGRLGLGPDEAFLGLRQYARSHRSPLRDVAQAVIDGTARSGPDRPRDRDGRGYGHSMTP